MKSLILASLVLSSSAFATEFRCGSLKNNGEAAVGGPTFSVYVEGKKVYLLTTYRAGLMNVRKEMKAVKGVLNTYALDDINASVKKFKGKTSVSITRVGNPDWAADCTRK